MPDFEKTAMARANGACEMCNSKNSLQTYEVSHATTEEQAYALLCETCIEQIDDKNTTDANHWRCLNESIWSEVPAIKVLAFRMLDRLKSEDWAVDLKDMMYLEEENIHWAEAGLDLAEGEGEPVHKDSNGVQLEKGDTVVLIKDLTVKGTTFTAKRGTAVRNINLVFDNHEHIEGKVNGTQIVILTKFVKKTI
jgi:protein PhnA